LDYQYKDIGLCNVGVIGYIQYTQLTLNQDIYQKTVVDNTLFVINRLTLIIPIFLKGCYHQ